MLERLKNKKLNPGVMRKLFTRFGPHLRGHRHTLAMAGLCMLGVTAMTLLKPWPMKIIFDGILIPREGSTTILDNFTVLIDNFIATLAMLPAFLANYPVLLANFPGLLENFPELLENFRALMDPSNVLLAVISLSILGIAVLSGLFGFGQAFLTASVGQKVVASIRRELYNHIQHLSHSFHDESRTGDLLARLVGDIRMMRELLVTSVIYVSDKILLLVGMLGIMLWMDWQLTLVALAIMPLLVLSLSRVGREIKGAARKQRRKEGKIANVITETLSSVTLIQTFAREAYEDERFSKQNNSSVKAGLVATRLEAQLDRLVQVTLAVGICAVIWFGVSRVQSGQLTPGDLLVFVSYVKGLYRPMRKLASLTGRLAKASVCGERILAILDTEAEIKDAPNALEAPHFQGDIVFENVDFSYRSGPPVLCEANFRIAPGETVALMGMSGSGKSTIASLVLRLYDPVNGRITIDGTDIRDYSLVSLRQQMAIVHQDSVLFSTTIKANIAYGKLEAELDEVIAAAKVAGAHEFVERLPEGYKTVVGERGDTLSGGQRQRIAIARAIIRNASIVILDEPTAGLDMDNKRKVYQGLAHLTANTTCLMITHDPQAATAADRVLTVINGRVSDITNDLPANESNVVLRNDISTVGDPA